MLSRKRTPKGGENETDSNQGAERRRRDADRAGDDHGGSASLLQVGEEIDQLLRDAGALVVPEVLNREACDSLVREMRASESRPSEPLNMLTGKRGPSENARQKMHSVKFIWEYSLRKHLEAEERLAAFLGQPYVVPQRFLFLSYERGSFIAPHRDGLNDSNEIAAAVFVLNDAFEGGEFVIHVEGRELALDVPSGSLIAFRSGVPHSVREVTDGVRFAAAGSLLRA